MLIISSKTTNTKVMTTKQKQDKVPTAKLVDLFRDVYSKAQVAYGIKLSDFNFQANEAVNFASLRNLYRCLKKDIESYYQETEGREPTYEEILSGIRDFMAKGFRRAYHWHYRKKLSDVFSFTPLSLYQKYNDIKQFKSPNKVSLWDRR